MIRREWLLGVGLISGGLGAAFGPTAEALAQNAPSIGTVAAVKPDAFGAAPGAAEQTLTIGADLVENQKIRTSTDGTANVIFADRSTLTVGKGSEVTLDKFVYDPSTGDGGLAIDLAQGALRFVGGKLSKDGNVTVKTPTATMTVRGGIGLFFQPPAGSGQDAYAVFLYGQELKNEDTGESIYRPGFAFKFPADGGPPQLVKITDEELANLLRNFNTESGFAGRFPDQDLALLENNPELIHEIRAQIEEQSQPNNPALESLRQFMATVASPDVDDPFGS
ncbi:FecR domain-containing protein [Dongia sp.]|uniref:FecR family protein n=1 Tax=Dongia sp. TaxID=1977262 RepID=UPI003750F08E